MIVLKYDDLENNSLATTPFYNRTGDIIKSEDTEVIKLILLILIYSLIIPNIILHTILLIDRIIHIIIRVCLKKNADPTLPSSLLDKLNEDEYPLVTIQLLMCNEICSVKSIIDCACQLDWPQKSLFVHVLDDSTDRETMKVIDNQVQQWKNQGIQIDIQRRENRHGFKAGSLQTAFLFHQNIEYIAIFDVDFLPKRDFLQRTIPYLMNDSNIAFVQTRWTFYNAKESFLTRMQEISLNFHHKCEQVVRCWLSIFFTFNGTGAVWRRSAIESSGGWQTDTLVEDLDMSFRVYHHGWKSVYLEHVECENELPPTWSAYLSQQHRWTCGPIQVMRKTIKSISKTKKISLPKKLFCYWFLLLQFNHLIAFIYFFILALCLYLTELSHITWLVFYLQLIVTILQVIFTPNEWYMCFFYFLFQNAIVYHKAVATLAGLFNFRSTQQWKVTQKYGSNNTKNAKNQIILYTKITPHSQPIVSYVNVRKPKSTNKLEKYDLVSWFDVDPHTKHLASSYRFGFNIRSFIDSLKNKLQKLLLIFLRIYKGNLLMALFFFVFFYLGIRNKQYQACFFSLANGIMYLIFACGYLGRSE